MVNKILKEALTSVPRVSKEEWKNLNLGIRWLIATRAGVLIITFLSSSLAGLFAYRANKFDAMIWILVTFGLLLAHSTNNLLNDYTDWVKGVDQDNYFRNRYGTHPMTVMTKQEMHGFILATGLSALSFGLYLSYLRGTEVLYLTLAGAFFLLFYTYPLKYIGLGEVSVFLVWGILMVGGGYFTITQEWSWEVCWASIPYALGATAILFGKHIDKLEADHAKGIYTLPVILGHSASRLSVQAMMALQYLFVSYLVYIRFFTPILLVVFLAIPRFVYVAKVYSQPKPNEEPKDYPKGIWPLYYVAFAFEHNRVFGSLFVLGMLVDTIYQKYF